MNTTAVGLRLVAAASALASVVALAGCAGAAGASSTTTVVPAAVHQQLVRSSADRYVSELLVRERMATGAIEHPAAERYVRELTVRARMAAEVRVESAQ